MNSYIFIFCLVLAVMPGFINAFFWNWDDENRVHWGGLPQYRGEWVAGGTYTVTWRFRRFTVGPHKYRVCLNKRWMRRKCFDANAVSPDANENGYYNATITLPSNLRSSDSYILELRRFGVLGIGNDEFAESPEIPIVSQRRYRKILNDKRKRQQSQQQPDQQEWTQNPGNQTNSTMEEQYSDDIESTPSTNATTTTTIEETASNNANNNSSSISITSEMTSNTNEQKPVDSTAGSGGNNSEIDPRTTSDFNLW